MSDNKEADLPADKALDDELNETDLNRVVGGKKVSPIDRT